MYMRRSMLALSAALNAISGSVLGAIETQRHTPEASIITRGGYGNGHHGWDTSRKIKGYMRGHQPRRSKAQRRARAA